MKEKIATLKYIPLIWLSTVTARSHLQHVITRTSEVFHYLAPSTEVYESAFSAFREVCALCCFLIPLPMSVTVSIHRIQRWEEPGQPDRGSLVQGEVKV